MFHLLDESLEDFLRTTVPLPAREIDVSFDAPDKDWAAKVSRPTINLYLWDVRRNVDIDALPPGRTVLQFCFRDVPPGQRNWWLVLSKESVDLCDFDPGHPLAGRIDTPLRLFTRVWRGDVAWAQAFRSGELRVEGPGTVQRNLRHWLTRSDFAAVGRPEDAEPGALTQFG